MGQAIHSLTCPILKKRELDITPVLLNKLTLVKLLTDINLFYENGFIPA